ncbi:MAG: GNAT family acetyltransferase [Candidatus Bathyarchaeia archaeon]
MVFRIVRYDAKYQNAVLELWHTCGLIRPQNNPVQDIERKMAFQPNLFFVALLNDEVVGAVMAGYEGHRGWLNYFAVAPAHQRRGYGRRLVERAFAELKKLGCPKVNLQVRRENASAIEFYRKLGFKEDDVLSFGKRLE